MNVAAFDCGYTNALAVTPDGQGTYGQLPAQVLPEQAMIAPATLFAAKWRNRIKVPRYWPAC